MIWNSYTECLDVESQIFNLLPFPCLAVGNLLCSSLFFLCSGGYTRLHGGRWSDSRALSCVERFDTFSQYWTTVSSLHQARCGLGVAVLRGMVYAIGGNNENNLFALLVSTYKLAAFYALYIARYYGVYVDIIVISIYLLNE